MNSTDFEKFVGLKDLALHLNVNKKSLRLWIRKTGIPKYKIGCFWKFKVSEVDRWLKKNGNQVD
jgi:excisionase family DNA binding protein